MEKSAPSLAEHDRFHCSREESEDGLRPLMYWREDGVMLRGHPEERGGVYTYSVSARIDRRALSIAHAGG